MNHADLSSSDGSLKERDTLTVSSYQSEAETTADGGPRKIIIWKDRNRSVQLLNVYGDIAESEDMAMDYLDNNPELVYAKFMTAYHCYDLIPTSSKLVVFDTQLNVKKAFIALIYNGVRAAPLWDSVQQNYVGMLTITDFIKILQKYYKQRGVQLDELEKHQISTWREELQEYTRPLVHITPEASLFEAIQMLYKYRVHRLPVIDTNTGNALFIMTHKRILRFLFLYIYKLPEPKFMQQTIEELKLGTYENIATATPETHLITAINMFVGRRISALPIVDAENRVIDIYAKFDVINVVAETSYNELDATIEQSMKNRRGGFEGVQTCKKNETLLAVMEKIVKAEVHRLVVVDDDRRIQGILSLSDLLHFIILKPSS